MKDSLTLTILPNGDLQLAASNDCRAYIREHRENMDDVSILCALTEPYWANGGFQPFNAEDANPFVGLTSAPCIAETLDTHDDGKCEVSGRLWVFMDYQIISPTEELMRRGRIIFKEAK